MPLSLYCVGRFLRRALVNIVTLVGSPVCVSGLRTGATGYSFVLLSPFGRVPSNRLCRPPHPLHSHTTTGNGGGGWYTSEHDYPDWFTIVEYCLLGFFGAELGLRAILADHDRSFWQSTVRRRDVW